MKGRRKRIPNSGDLPGNKVEAVSGGDWGTWRETSHSVKQNTDKYYEESYWMR
jgi:hypothetical protein